MMRNLQETMESILSSVNDWLKFSEAKNGALLALNCALIFGVIRGLATPEDLPDTVVYYAIFVIFQLACSLIFALVSFLPRLNPPWWIQFPKITDQENPLYFGSICKFTPKKYLSFIMETLEDSESSRIHEHLSNQIVVNSKIAFIKYRQFSIALWILISAILTPLGAYIFSIVKK